MAFRPNFSGNVRLKGNKLTVAGLSNDYDVPNIVTIQVFVAQDAKGAGGGAEPDQQVAMGAVAQVGPNWTATISNAGLVAGPAVAIGIETHRKPFRTITWAQQVEIQK